MQTIVIGHKNPDMDSICSAIAYARLKQLTGMQGVVAARAGNTNQRIDFILQKFGFEPPMFVSDVTPSVRDVMQTDVICVRKGTPIYDALQEIDSHNIRALPVVDEDSRLLGLLSAFKAGGHLYPPRDKAGASRIVNASLADILRTISGEVLCGNPDDQVNPYTLVVAAMNGPAFEGRMKREEARHTIVFLYDREEIRDLALEVGVRAIVITANGVASPEFLERAAAAGVTVARAPYDTATTVLLARASLSVDNMLEQDVLTLSPDLPLDAARERVSTVSAFVFPVVDEENRLVGILSKSDFLKSIQRQLILVDHNELTQAVKGAEKLRIIEILDHHRLGGFTSQSPMLFWNNPIGSTSSIVALCYQQLGVSIPRDIAGLLMAGLISDTLNLTSPTATSFDAEILGRLAAITRVDPSELAAEIFSVGSPLATMSAEQAILADSKEYTEDGYRFTVAQIEELSFTRLEENQEALLVALNAQVQSRQLLFAALLVTDVNTQNSRLLVCGSERFTKEIDYPALSHSVWELNGVVSRKKQLLPFLLQCLAEMGPES